MAEVVSFGKFYAVPDPVEPFKYKLFFKEDDKEFNVSQVIIDDFEAGKINKLS